MYYYIRLSLLPYRLENRALYLTSAGNTFLLVIIEILIEYLVIHGIVSVTGCIQNHWHNNEMLGGWIVEFSPGERDMAVGVHR